MAPNAATLFALPGVVARAHGLERGDGAWPAEQVTRAHRLGRGEELGLLKRSLALMAPNAA